MRSGTSFDPLLALDSPKGFFFAIKKKNRMRSERKNRERSHSFSASKKRSSKSKLDSEIQIRNLVFIRL